MIIAILSQEMSLRLLVSEAAGGTVLCMCSFEFKLLVESVFSFLREVLIKKNSLNLNFISYISNFLAC